MGLLDGKVALVTGAARGQGRAHAVTCAREGAEVVMIDFAEQILSVPYALAGQEDLHETARLVREHDRDPIVRKVDVRDQAALDAVVAEAVGMFGHLDILIANAGIWGLNNFWEFTEQEWDDMLAVNLTGVWKSAKAVTPQMIKQSSGSIVITGSGQCFEPSAGFAHYTAAKYGVLGLMKNIALELGPHGVRCNIVSPGAVGTGMLRNPVAYDMFAGRAGGGEADLVRGASHYHLLKGVNVLDPQVIADAALFLNSELASHITGIELPVEAGHRLIPGFNHNPLTAD